MDNKVLYPETIKAQDLPAVGETDSQVSNPSSLNTTGGKEYAPASVKANQLPKRIIAHDIMSPTLNTQSKQILDRFNFGKMGSIQIGDYESGNGEGDIKISPAGIVARGTDGQTTFAINAKTGDATFSGDIVGGTIAIGSNMFSVDVDGNVIANSIYLASSYAQEAQAGEYYNTDPLITEVSVELEFPQILLLVWNVKAYQVGNNDYRLLENDVEIDRAVGLWNPRRSMIINAAAGIHLFKMNAVLAEGQTWFTVDEAKISVITLGRF